jgi:hypothetical protein
MILADFADQARVRPGRDGEWDSGRWLKLLKREGRRLRKEIDIIKT